MQNKRITSQGLTAIISELAEISRLTSIYALARLDSSTEGLGEKDVEERLLNYGPNEIAHEKVLGRI